MKQKNLSDILIIASVGIIGVLLVYLYAVGQLAYYVRPDYHIFTLATGLVLIVSAIVSLRIPPDTHAAEEHRTAYSLIVSFVMIAVFIGGFIIPKRPLSSLTADKRGGSDLFAGQNSLADTTLQTHTSVTSVNTENYSIADWYKQFISDPEPDNYAGKKISVSGFIKPNRDETFTVSRFLITCCVVDAIPIGLYVDAPVMGLKTDGWVTVTGVFETKSVDGTRQAVIKPTEIKQINPPANPYMY